MKDITLYECEYCHTQYAKKGVCEACETNHKQPKIVTNMRYLSKEQDHSGYPIDIVVKMSNGESIKYKRG